MKRMLVCIITVLLFPLFVIADERDSIVYVYQNDNVVVAMPRSEVDSITYSYIDENGISQNYVVTQLIHTDDSVYSLPLNIVDSVTFLMDDNTNIVSPCVYTKHVTNIKYETATLNGCVRGLVNSAIQDHIGFYISQSYEELKNGGGQYVEADISNDLSYFSAYVAGLIPDEKYYYRAQLNYNGCIYQGLIKNFKTQVVSPIVVDYVDEVGCFHAVLHGNANLVGMLTEAELGFYISNTRELDVDKTTLMEGVKKNVDGKVKWEMLVPELTPEKEYYYWSYVKTSGKLFISYRGRFATKTLPIATEETAYNDIKSTTAPFAGRIDADDFLYSKGTVGMYVSVKNGYSEDYSSTFNYGLLSECENALFEIQLGGLPPVSRVYYAAYYYEDDDNIFYGNVRYIDTKGIRLNTSVSYEGGATATFNGNIEIVDDEYTIYDEVGFYYYTEPIRSTSSMSLRIKSNLVGDTFESVVSDLPPNTILYVRAYAVVNGMIFISDDQVKFSTNDWQDLSIHTDSVSDITSTTAVFYGHVAFVDEPHSTGEVSFYYYTQSDFSDLRCIPCGSLESYPSGVFSAFVDGFTPETQIYFFACYTPQEEIEDPIYGEIKSFVTTEEEVFQIQVSTLEYDDVTETSAVVCGKIERVLDMELNGTIRFLYGIENEDFDETTVGNLKDFKNNVFQSQLIDLIPDKLYYYQVVLLLEDTVLFGEKKYFSTLKPAQYKEVSQDNIDYKINLDNQTAEVIQGGWWQSSLVIPESITSEGKKYEVTSIAKQAFSNKDFVSVSIPSSVTSIGEQAFSYCLNLKEVIIPNSVTSIGNMAFEYCESLKSATISENVKEFAPMLFNGCVALRTVNIPEGVLSIGSMAFQKCKSLKNVVLPNSLKKIGSDAFSDCDSLDSIFIPQNVVEIESNPFSYCKKLKSVVVSQQNKVYDSRDNCNAIIETSTNTLLFGCNKTQIPVSVTAIGPGAFIGSGLSEIIIPENTISMGNSAFYRCENLASLQIKGNISIIPESAFCYCSALTNLVVPEGVKIIERNAFDYCYNLQCITLPSTIEEIGYTFAYVKNVTDVYCYASRVPKVDYFSFDDFEKKATLHVPSSSVSKYSSTGGWNNFVSVIALPE